MNKLAFSVTRLGAAAAAAVGISVAVAAGVAFAASPDTPTRPPVSPPATALTPAAPSSPGWMMPADPSNLPPMMASMRAGLSPEARVQFDRNYGQMRSLMASTPMMGSGAGMGYGARMGGGG